MSQIVLDAEAFKALSSDTRLQILKALDARRLTVSELGRLLKLNKATVFEHLQQLAKADLVKKEDEGRKWVYYRLTWKGKNVLHPENVQFMLLLATSLFSIGGLVTQLGRVFDWWGWSTSTSELAGPKPDPTLPFAPAADGMPSNEAPTMTGGTAPSPSPTATDSAAASQAPGATTGAATGTQAAAQGAPASGTLTSHDQEYVPVVRANFDSDSAGVEPEALTQPPEVWDDANFWLIGALVLLLVATAIFTWRYLVERHQERAPMRKRIAALPPPEPD